MNKPQIKVDELPKNWLVLDYHVESGPVDFVSVEYKCQCGTDNINKVGIGTDKTSGLQVCCWCGKPGFSPKKTFGTKHIKLIDVNTDIEWFGEGPSAECYFIDRDGYGIYKGADALSVSGCKQTGEDFFIYKVTEEKDVK